MCQAGGEGIISKKADAPYRGTRSKAWLKVKCTRRQEFVIIGWSQSDKKGRGFRALLLGLHEDGKLRYAGKVGTGFSVRAARLCGVALRRWGGQGGSPVPAPKRAARLGEAGAGRRSRLRGVHGRRRRPPRQLLGLRATRSAQVVARNRTTALRWRRGRGRQDQQPRAVLDPDRTSPRASSPLITAVAPLMLAWSQPPDQPGPMPAGRAKKCFFQSMNAGTFGTYIPPAPDRERTARSRTISSSPTRLD
jgi:bifunctional non-homologous end joining protein LigD